MTKRREAPQIDMNNLPRALSPDEAAQVLSITQATYYRHVHPAVKSRAILSITVGRQRRILTASLLAWVEQRAQREAWT